MNVFSVRYLNVFMIFSMSLLAHDTLGEFLGDAYNIRRPGGASSGNKGDVLGDKYRSLPEHTVSDAQKFSE